MPKSTKPENVCSRPRCNNPVELTYLGAKICHRCYCRLIEAEESDLPPVTKRAPEPIAPVAKPVAEPEPAKPESAAPVAPAMSGTTAPAFVLGPDAKRLYEALWNLSDAAPDQVGPAFVEYGDDVLPGITGRRRNGLFGVLSRAGLYKPETNRSGWISRME